MCTLHTQGPCSATYVAISYTILTRCVDPRGSPADLSTLLFYFKAINYQSYHITSYHIPQPLNLPLDTYSKTKSFQGKTSPDPVVSGAV